MSLMSKVRKIVEAGRTALAIATGALLAFEVYGEWKKRRASR